VCTHGTRDACCARLGRPLATALTDLDPENTWEISHSGGHRLAGVVLALPEGLVYGRVEIGDVPGLTAARARGELVTGLLRGQGHLGEPEQAADVALRQHLSGPTSPLDAVTWAGTSHADGVTRTRWTSSASEWVVDLERVDLPERPGSCGKAPEPVSAWRVTAITRS
jgi:hypothetical protein